MHMMQMVFTNSRNVELLFPGAKTKSAGTYTVALIIVFLAGVGAIALKYGRILLEQKMSRAETPRIHKGIIRFFAVSGSYGWDYLLMLAVMSFNLGVFLAAIGGLASGVVLFGDALISGHKKGAMEANGISDISRAMQGGKRMKNGRFKGDELQGGEVLPLSGAQAGSQADRLLSSICRNEDCDCACNSKSNELRQASTSASWEAGMKLGQLDPKCCEI